MMLSALGWTSLALAAVPTTLLLWNLILYRPAPPLADSPLAPGTPESLGAEGRGRSVSILIPARDEEEGIAECVRAAAASRGVRAEVIVLDDHSRDATHARVRELAVQDPRIRLERGAELPPGWSGKQFACQQLSQQARFPLLLFLDADVRLQPTAVARMVQFLEASDVDLISGFPRQRVTNWLDGLLIPLIHFILLGFLPLVGMRHTNWPAFAAGCGQLFLVRRTAYERVGGHAQVRQSLHDGIQLPRAFRRAGATTDLFDATDLAVCRMYTSAGDTWRGLAKNAVEGLAAPRLILLATVVLLGGQVLPFLACSWGALSGGWPTSVWIVFGVAVALAYLPRWIGVFRFRQPVASAWLHPLGVLVFLTLQWFALLRWVLGRPADWKGRAYTQ